MQIVAYVFLLGEWTCLELHLILSDVKRVVESANELIGTRPDCLKSSRGLTIVDLGDRQQGDGDFGNSRS
jgi:hypothetical protein